MLKIKMVEESKNLKEYNEKKSWKETLDYLVKLKFQSIYLNKYFY